MEIFRREKKSEWKNIIKDLKNSKICDQERLDSIGNSLKEGKTLFESDRVYLESKIKELTELKNSNSLESNPIKTIDQNAEKYLKMIKNLNQKEVGDVARLESISNYLNDGMSVLAEDEEYILEKHKQLENKKTWRKNAQPQTILIDDFETHPTHNFDSLSKTISGIIKNSNPHFTIGIYGEWGTGKTTLMRATEKNLTEDGVPKTKQKILTVWFNAWKYEREENLAALSLMKTVAYAMEDHEKFDILSKTVFQGLTIFGKDLIQQLALKIVSKESNNLEEELARKMDYMNKLYKDSVYFDGLEKIRQQMQGIRESEGKDYRVVIFIDDLDRCSSSKALEVLESIKLFLDMEGFVFVIGLNHKTVTQLITHAYETTGVKGEDYIKKIIQIPIKIPSWSDENLVNLIENRISKNLNEEYTQFLRQNSTMVAKVIDYNPRQLKRFINNVIVAFETFASNENSPQIKFDEIFLVKILKKEWPDFYTQFVRSKDFRDLIRWLTTQPKNLKKYFKYLNATTEDLPIEQKNKRLELLNKLQTQTNNTITPLQIDILADFTSDSWEFLSSVKKILFEVDDWKILDNVMDVVEEFQYDVNIGPKQVQKIEPEN